MTVNPFLEPGELLGEVAVVSKRMRKAAFDIWIRQAIDEASRSTNHTAVQWKLKSLGDTMTTHSAMTAHSAAMCYVFFQEYSRELTADKRMTNRKMRDIITRSIIRDVGFGRVDLISKVEELFGEYATRNVSIFSQIVNSYVKQLEDFKTYQQRHLVADIAEENCNFVMFGECACGRCPAFGGLANRAVERNTAPWADTML